jgi:hypothetical protein
MDSEGVQGLGSLKGSGFRVSEGVSSPLSKGSVMRASMPTPHSLNPQPSTLNPEDQTHLSLSERSMMRASIPPAAATVFLFEAFTQRF